MANGGWLKSHRCTMESKLWELSALDFKVAWLLLYHAKWDDDRYVTESGFVIELKRGELVATRGWIKENLGKHDRKHISEEKIRTSLDHLERIEFLTRHITRQLPIITICNYETYQQRDDKEPRPDDRPCPDPAPTLPRPCPVSKEVKEGKELKEKTTITKKSKSTSKANSEPSLTKEEVIAVVNKEFKWLIDTWNEFAPEHLKIVQVPRDFDVNDVFACRALLLKLNLTHEQIRVAIINWFTKAHWHSEQGHPSTLSLRQWLAKDTWVRKMAFLGKQNGSQPVDKFAHLRGAK